MHIELDRLSTVFKIEWKIACFGGLLSVVLASLMISGFSWPDFNFPYCYTSGVEGDSFYTLAYIKRILECTFFNSTQLGYPFGSEMADFPGWDLFSSFFFKISSLFSSSPISALNLFIISSYFINFAVCFIVLRALKISNSIAFLGALLFNFIPFHFMRFHHFTYTQYYCVPIYFYLSFNLYNDENNNLKEWLSKNKFFLLLAVICASSVVYYTFFGVILLLIVGLGASAFHQSWKPFYKSLGYSVACGATIFIMLLPSTIHTLEHGKNTSITRTVGQTEIAALKISQLVLPHIYHRIDSFKDLSKDYTSKTTIVYETVTSALGIFGTLGFLALLGLIFFMRSHHKIDQRLMALSLLTFGMLLIGTVGGFSTLFSLFITGFIRSWNRISLFIGFASITATCIFLEQYFKDKLSPRLLTIGCAVIGGLCFFDQTPAPPITAEIRDKIKQKFTADKKFTQAMEALVPQGSAIFQYPHVPYPEHGYEHIVPYIHSNTLALSFGTINGRKGDAFYRELDKEPLDKQLDVIKKMGFQGIYIDKAFYKDGGALIVEKLTELLGKKPDIISDDLRYAFFKLEGVARVKLDGLSYYEIAKIAYFNPGAKNAPLTRALLEQMMYGVR